jgi:hypothetical protein
MKTYLIGYDLNKPEANYPKLIENIKKIANKTWWHHLDSTWIIKSNRSTESILNELKASIDNDDELLVVRLNGEGSWTGFTKKGSDWLKNNLTLN